jgi:hypothetical protein
MAKASFFLGLLSWVLFGAVICLLILQSLFQVLGGLVLAWIGAAFSAVVMSALARKVLKANPAFAGKGLARAGAVMGYASLIVIVVAVVLPNFMKARTTASKNACINCLRQFDGAKEQWALENKKTASDTPTFEDLIGTDKYIKVMLACPANGTYTLGSMAVLPVCSILAHTLDIYAHNRELTCEQSLSVLRVAKQQWLHTADTAARIPTERDLRTLIKQEAYGNAVPKLQCEARGAFIIGNRDEKPRCSVRAHTW